MHPIWASFQFGESRARIKKYYREDVVLRNARGQRLQCSHYRPCIVTSKDGRLPCTVYCHTNSGSRRDAEEILFHLLPKGMTVFALDFAGSGLSEGEFVTLGAQEVDDLAAAVQYLREEGSTSTLGLWGRSMGAVSALLYAARDPTIAAVVADSPFSRLVDLMLELGTDTQQGLNVPRPLVKVALAMMRRSVRRRAGFSIDDVSPLDTAPATFVPALFGHADDDTFVAPHHSQRLHAAYAAESKNLATFEGDHNSMRPDFWYTSATIFLVGALQVEVLVGPDVDLHAVSLEEAPHLVGRGIYVASGRSEGGSEEEREEVAAAGAPGSRGVGRALHHEVRPPWDSAAVRSSRRSGSEAAAGHGSESSGGAVGEEGDAIALQRGNDLAQQEEEMLQRVLEMSLLEAHAKAGALPLAGSGGFDGAAESAEVRDDEAELARAIEESLRTAQAQDAATADEHGRRQQCGADASHGLPGAAQDSEHPRAQAPKELHSAAVQAAVQRHSAEEAEAVQAVSLGVHSALADAVEAYRHGDAHAAAAALVGQAAPALARTSPGEGPHMTSGEDELQALRVQIAQLSGYVGDGDDT